MSAGTVRCSVRVEAMQVTRLSPGQFDGFDLGMGRATLQEMHEVLELGTFALHDDFDPTVTQVFRVPVQAEVLCVALNEHAVADPLNPAGNQCGKSHIIVWMSHGFMLPDMPSHV